MKQLIAVLVLVGGLALPPTAGAQGTGDPDVLAMMHAMNARLAARGANVAVDEIHFYTIGNGRPSNRIHQQTSRWVPNDPRRAAQGEDITFIIDASNGATASGLSAADTGRAILQSMTTWNDSRCMGKMALVQKGDPGVDLSIFDDGSPWDDVPGEDGTWWAADIVNVGWYPRAYFEAVGGPGGGRGILAFSVSFIFGSFDSSGAFVPSDINGDNYNDTALNEVYYNDTFGDAGDDRAGNPWGINAAIPGIDVGTVSLHENGHSLGLGHFGPPPSAVMNPVYAGPNQDPDAIDSAGMCAVWASWPNP